MAWVYVDMNGQELLSNSKPKRNFECTDRINSYTELFFWVTSDISISLPEGSIEYLTKRKLHWYNEPIEVKKIYSSCDGNKSTIWLTNIVNPIDAYQKHVLLKITEKY